MATFVNTEFCTYTEVEEYIRDLGPMLGTERGDQTIGNQIGVKIRLAKRRMRSPLIEECRKRFPDSLEALIRFSQLKLDEYVNRTNRNIQQSGVRYLSSAGENYLTLGHSINAQEGSLHPRLYYFSEAPTNGVNGTFAGEAENGSFGIDATNWVAYINRGSKASPTWGQYTADDLIDYMFNPDVLKDWAILETAKLCFFDGAFRNKMEGWDGLAIVDFTKLIDKDLERMKSTALKELKFDISNDGLLSNFENTRVKKQGFWA